MNWLLFPTVTRRMNVWTARIRLNLWFLLSFFVCLGAFLLALNEMANFNSMQYQLNGLCTSANAAFRNGGPERLSYFLEWMNEGLGLQLHLLDVTGKDLASGEDRSGWLRGPEGRHWGPPREPVIIRRTATFVCALDLGSPPRMPIRPPLWLVPFLSILCCSVAAYVTLRVRRIESAVRDFGSGQLGTRTTAQPGDPIGRLGKSFNEMADRIESLVDAHKRLCSDISHELRSPLGRLLLGIQLVRRGNPGAIDRIEAEVSRVSDLVDELLSVFRAEVDPTTVRGESIEIESLLTEIADRNDMEAQARNCEIILRAIDPGVLMGDQELLTRAVENVVRNAVQHSPSGALIEISAHGDDEAVHIEIRDHGPGVPESALVSIFRAFYRVEPDRNRDSGGTGLGLAIAQRAVAVHQGTILAENANPGLRIEIRLPRK